MPEEFDPAWEYALRAVELARRVSEQKQRCHNYQAVIEAARKRIRARGQFTPKPVKGMKTVRVCF